MNDTALRPTFVLVWPDGTVQIDSPESNRNAGLAVYLESVAYGHNDEPLANVYAVDKQAEPNDASPLGVPLRQVKIVESDRTIEANDWIYIAYDIRWMDDDTARPLTGLTIRIDGRA